MGEYSVNGTLPYLYYKELSTIRLPKYFPMNRYIH